MHATFQVKITMSLPSVQTKEEMLKWIQTIVGDINEHLDDDIESIELLNHTLIFRG